jgi:hypothetical protein
MTGWREKETERQKELAKRLAFYLRGNIDAVRFCIDILFVGHLWDDLIDGDKERTPDEVNAAFRTAMGDIPTNPFYQDNIRALSGLLMSAFLQWQDSNVLAKGNMDDAMTCFMIRNSLMAVIHYCLLLTGGPVWAAQQGPAFWHEFGAGITEKYQEFLEEQHA